MLATASVGGASNPDGAAEIVKPSTGAPLKAGGSRTDFRIKLPTGAACTGDSAKAGYRIQGYLVPRSVDPGTLTFDAGVGPGPVAGQFRAALYESSSSSYVDQQTAEAARVGGPGPIIQPLPALNLAVFDPALGFPFKPGAYNLGIACTLGPPSPTQLDRYWNAVMTVTADSADTPAMLSWSVATDDPETTKRSPAGRIAAVAGVVGAVAVVCTGVFLLRRRGRAPAAALFPETYAKET